MLTSILAIASMPLVAPLGIFFLLVTAWEMREFRSARRNFRIQDRHLRTALWVRRLVWLGFAEFVLVFFAYVFFFTR